MNKSNADASDSKRFDISDIDTKGFLRELSDLRREINEDLGEKDIRHLKKMERWGRWLTAIGVLTAGLMPNPVSMVCLALGRNNRWVMMHHISHSGYERVPGLPKKYTRKVFGQGRRRFIDWLDWLTPETWAYEHNVLHHAYTAESRDPDLIERNTESLREMGLPKAIRYLVMFMFSLMWRPMVYAPMAMDMWKKRDNKKQEDAGKYDVDVILKAFFDRDYWRTGFIPCFLFLFVIFPLLYLPFGLWAAFSALCNAIGAEIIYNIHAYIVVLPNHCGDDLFRYEEPNHNREERKIRQIVSSANYSTGSDLLDFSQMWLNYQIEHHIWPDLPMLRYREVQPRVKALCEKYDIPYVQENIFKRLDRMLKVVMGDTSMRKVNNLQAASATSP
jgi:fatty acid desaturase